MIWPIYIPSKGRPGTVKIPSECEDETSLVVQPNELKAYREISMVPLLCLPENDMGLARTRQWIKHYAHEHGQEWHWQIDDDVSGWFTVDPIRHRNQKSSARQVLTAAQSYAQAPKVAFVGLEWQGTAWSSHNPYSVNKMAASVLGIRATPWHFDAQMLVKEDLDYVLRLLTAGLWTVKCHWLAYDAPRHASNHQGGLYETYRQGAHDRDARLIAERWPKYARVIPLKDAQRWANDDGRQLDVKVNWNAFAVGRAELDFAMTPSGQP